MCVCVCMCVYVYVCVCLYRDLHVSRDWLPLITENEENDAQSFVEPHYPIRGLTGKLPEELVKLTENTIQSELEVRILSYIAFNECIL